MRLITKRYQDPLDLIWIQTAGQLGIEIQRDPHVFAAWDGQQVLRIGTVETLDADDCLAQMIFHELCHALVEGPAAFQIEDWGLSNDVLDRSPFDNDSSAVGGIVEGSCPNLLESSDSIKIIADPIEATVHEFACLRLQAALADQFGLRRFLTATTDFREYYERLPPHPLEDQTLPEVALAIQGWNRAIHGPWSKPIDRALSMTAAITQIVASIAPDDSLWSANHGTST